MRCWGVGRDSAAILETTIVLTLTEAVIIRTSNDRLAATERDAAHAVAILRRQLENERAARRSDRAAHEADRAALLEEIALLREIATEAMASA